MKTKYKALLLSFCAVLLVCASVLGTMAFLTSTDAVENTFTVGKIKITLDETKVNADGTKDTTTTNPVKENTYHLLPGHTYIKDPTVHVEKGSENAWLFVKVESGITPYEAATVKDGYQSIAKQLEDNGWTVLDATNHPNVYYKKHTKDTTQDVDHDVFEEFKIADNANEVSGWDNIKPESTKINVTAYAVQMDGFNDVNSDDLANAKAAWEATFGATSTPEATTTTPIQSSDSTTTTTSVEEEENPAL